MTIMDMVRNWKERNSEKSEKFKQMQEDDRLQTMLEERKKSSNERELQRYYRKLREDDIKKQVDAIHKKQSKESWRGKQMFNGKCTILKSDKNVLTNDNSMFNSKSIFLRGSLY